EARPQTEGEQDRDQQAQAMDDPDAQVTAEMEIGRELNHPLVVEEGAVVVPAIEILPALDFVAFGPPLGTQHRGLVRWRKAGCVRLAGRRREFGRFPLRAR